MADPQGAAFEALPHIDPRRPWLIGSWSWRVIDSAGVLLADGEGCSTAGAAIETARIVSREEFAIQKDVEIVRLRSVIVGCEIALNRDDDVNAVRRLLIKERHANGY